MTRQEAIANVNAIQKTSYGSNIHSSVLVDCLAALGLLTLEDPPSVRSKLKDILTQHEWVTHDEDMFREALDDAGLQIVEKP